MFCFALATTLSTVVLPTQSLTLSWMHSVEKVLWEEDYQLHGDKLILREARIRSSGAGMEAISGATWQNGYWRYAPNLGFLSSVRLANSEFVQGYALCWDEHCRPLDAFFSRGSTVELTVRSCDR
jgi:hypothetical protein